MKSYCCNPSFGAGSNTNGNRVVDHNVGDNATVNPESTPLVAAENIEDNAATNPLFTPPVVVVAPNNGDNVTVISEPMSPENHSGCLENITTLAATSSTNSASRISKNSNDNLDASVLSLATHLHGEILIDPSISHNVVGALSQENHEPLVQHAQ
ncbi:hypothetical protein AAG906_015994 [Vitis piasezkii]